MDQVLAMKLEIAASQNGSRLVWNEIAGVYPWTLYGDREVFPGNERQSRSVKFADNFIWLMVPGH